VLSNHGGRQLDFARSGIEVLAEVVTHLREKRGLEVPSTRFSLFVDGGLRRATDALKAIALGATAGKYILFSSVLSDLTCIIGSWCRAIVLVRILHLWDGGCGTCVANSAGASSPVPLCCHLTESIVCRCGAAAGIG
jgi:hypothetical protein